MITINKTIYEALAADLATALRDTDFFNGTVEYDTEEVHAELRCTLVLYRDPASGRLTSAVPVWWEFHTFQPGGEVPNDFSWREFSPCLEIHF